MGKKIVCGTVMAWLVWEAHDAAGTHSGNWYGGPPAVLLHVDLI